MRMRLIIGTGLIALATAVAAVLIDGGDANSTSGGSGPKPDKVVASFYPLAFAAEQIDGSAQVENLTPPGAEPHDLELTPRDIEEIRSAELVLLMGKDFQPQLESAAGSGTGVVRVLETSGLRLRSDDPHVWLDPLRFQSLVAVIGEKLAPTDGYRLRDKLGALDAEFKAGLANCKRRQIVTSHDAFGYLAERYGLEQVPISGLSPEAEPTPSGIRNAADAVRESGATTIFTETLVSPDLADTVARETGAQTAVLNPLEGLTTEQQESGEDYFSVMRENLAALRKALECR